MPDRAFAWSAYALALLVVLLDQGSKLLAQSLLEYARPVAVFSWFDLTLHYNRGAAFSFLSNADGWQRWLFTGLALVVSVALATWIWRLSRVQLLLGLGLALVLGGAIGNVIDRLLLGHVVDFISVHYAGHYFPTFNIADSAISIGAVLLLVDGFRGGENRHE